MVKRCSACGATKPLDEFYTDSHPRNKTGRQSRCKECAKAYASAYAKANPKDRAKERERLRQRRLANPDEGREYGRKWREKNGERALELARKRAAKWRRDKPERKVASEMRRRAVLRDITEEDMTYMAILRNDPCSYCGEPADSTDHIVPIHNGGEPGWTNQTAACRSCNCSKQARSLLVFLAA